MSALGQKQTFAVQKGMSVKGQKRTLRLSHSINLHLVGAGEQLDEFEANRLAVLRLITSSNRTAQGSAWLLKYSL
jgi:hypothetical protein